MHFDYDSPIIRFINKGADLLVLNLLFLVCSIPIVTMGASLTAMYAVNLRSVRYGDGYVAQTFFKAFKQSFVQATIAWVIVAVCGLLIFFDIRFWSVMGEGLIQKMMLAVSYALAGILFALSIWLFPLIAKMKDSLKNQFANAAKMAVGYFIPYTLACLLIQGISVFLATVNVAMLLLMLVIGIAIVSYMCSFFLYKVFAKHIKEESMGVDDLLYQEENDDEQSNN